MREASNPRRMAICTTASPDRPDSSLVCPSLMFIRTVFGPGSPIILIQINSQLAAQLMQFFSLWSLSYSNLQIVTNSTPAPQLRPRSSVTLKAPPRSP